MNIITHPGVFHADDVLAVAILQLIDPELTVERRVPMLAELADPNVTVIDCGGEYNPAHGNFDHHQVDTPERDGGAPYAAAGLVWREYGQRVCARAFPDNPDMAAKLASRVDERIMLGVDAWDNGVGRRSHEGEPPTLSQMIAWRNQLEATPADRLVAFTSAAAWAEDMLLRALEGFAENMTAAEEVAAMPSENGILLMPRYVPWQEAIQERDDCRALQFVIYPALRSGWNAQAVNVSPEEFGIRVPFPAEWRGASAERLQELTGQPLTFCHKAGFLAAGETREAVIAAARLAIEAAK